MGSINFFSLYMYLTTAFPFFGSRSAQLPGFEYAIGPPALHHLPCRATSRFEALYIQQQQRDQLPYLNAHSWITSALDFHSHWLLAYHASLNQRRQ